MPCGPCGPVRLRRMLERPWPGQREAAPLLVAPILGPHLAPVAPSMRASVESPIKTPIGLSTFRGTNCELRVETTQQQLGRSAYSTPFSTVIPSSCGFSLWRLSDQRFPAARGVPSNRAVVLLATWPQRRGVIGYQTTGEGSRLGGSTKTTMASTREST